MDIFGKLKDMTSFLAPYSFMILAAGIILWMMAKNKLAKNRSDQGALTMKKVGLALTIGGAAVTAIHMFEFETT